ncbi:hypothetical protein J4Q44_G00373630 [Coregonus suidteri]|uniref:Uncharacterized protein n=1 Tax=Coregonus suidteri TaxID=861788 RepID=A0AAN8KB33_9TELE
MIFFIFPFWSIVVQHYFILFKHETNVALLFYCGRFVQNHYFSINHLGKILLLSL